jgi:hypothetical protein
MIRKLAIAATVVLMPTFAEAHQLRCARDGAAMVENLSQAWGEVAVGEPRLVNPNVYLQEYANTEEGNWTILSHGRDGSACIQHAGVGYGGVDPSKARTQPRPAGLDL